MTAALGIDRSAKLGFASSYFFQYFTFESKDYVSVIFRDDKGEIISVPIGCALRDPIADVKHACQADQFKVWI